MIELTVPDMTCGSCVNAITRTLKAADPDAKVDVSLADKRVRVQSVLSQQDVERRIAEAGFTPNGEVTPRGGCC